MINKIKPILVIALFFLSCFSAYTNTENSEVISNKQQTTELAEILSDSVVFQISQDDPVVLAMDELTQSPYLAKFDFQCDTSVQNIYEFATDSIPVYPDSILRARLQVLDEQTPFNLTFNSITKAFINLYAVKKRELTARFLGLSEMYFPMFESTLDNYNLHLEFKYLAVVESALNPKARSRAGATGMWQFKYATGKMYDLKVTSYTDDRMDVYKSTVAACNYFKHLYRIYGNWELVMAAYNCGPGNVNKAIRRSGYKRNYWEIYPYLPRETRGYVPAFIAVNYIMNHAAEHNIYAIEPPALFFQFDSVHVKEAVKFTQLSETLNIPIETLEALNPVYKQNYIPNTHQKQVLLLPQEKIGLFIENEELVYQLHKKDLKENPEPEKIIQEERLVHVVRNGEYLGKIAARYGCSVGNIKAWNNISGTRINKGQRLVIYTNPSADTKTPASTIKIDPNAKYYTIQKGDTLWDIAVAKGVSVSKIQKMNNHLNVKRLKPGDKIVIASGS